ncbi:MAG: T9SS type A sorting domain-containing protein [Bacteroidetes bacterium]|nr:MAG: T9SS type A sorting domain-containing protein [Bacteroidota bacterium]
MKKIIQLSLILILACSASYSQTIPNNGFENWISMGSYNNVDSWSTLNDMTSTASTYTCVKGTPGNVGSAYIKLTTKTVIGMGVMPGIAFSGEFDYATMQPTSGFAISTRPQSLSGKWQYMASGSDQGFIAVALTKWNFSTMMRDTVAFTYHDLQGMVMSWGSFNIPLNYMNGDDPDSCFIVLSASSAYGAAAVPNSYLYVDDLNFNGTVLGISEREFANNITVSPNPSKDIITVTLPEFSEKFFSYKIIDLQGKTILNVENLKVNSTFQIDINTLAKGNYMLNIYTPSVISSKRITKQ